MTQTRRKTFRFNRDSDVLPLIVDLDGVEIRCRPALDGLTLMSFTEAVSAVAGLDEDTDESEVSDDMARSGMAAAKSFLDLLKAVVLPEDWDLFTQTVRDQSIDIRGLAEITGWLVGQYSGRPTPPS